MLMGTFFLDELPANFVLDFIRGVDEEFQLRQFFRRKLSEHFQERETLRQENLVCLIERRDEIVQEKSKSNSFQK